MADRPWQGERVPGIDAWRAALMLAGLLVHARFMQEPRPLFEAINFVSAHLRMGIFLVVSGLLAGSATAGRDLRGWSRRRIVRIAVPLATGLAMTAPLIALLARPGSIGASPMPNLLEPYHLWFLLALLVYVPLVPAFDLIDARFAIVNRLCRSERSPLDLQLLLFGATVPASALLMAATTAARLHWSAVPLPAADHLHLIAGYAPVFALGVLLGRSPPLLSRLLSDMRGPTIALLSTLLVEMLVLRNAHGPAGDLLAKATLILGLAACPVAAAALVLRSAFRIGRAGVVAHRLCDASMTMYVVHFPILALLNFGVATVDWNVYAEYAIAVVLSGTLSYGFHRRLVRRSAILTFLFTGAGPPRRGWTSDAVPDPA